MEDDFERLLNLEEKMNVGELTSEEIDEYNRLMGYSLEESESNEFDSFKNTINSLKEALLPKIEKMAGEIVEETKRISTDIKPYIPSNVDETKAMNVANKLKDRVKNISIPTIPFTQKNCNHELFYLLFESPSFNFESKLFRSLDNSKCVCKCLNCGKGLIIYKNDLGCNTIIEDESIRSDERYKKVRNHYLSLKFHKYSGQKLIDALYSELENEKSEDNVPRLKL